MLGVPQTLIGLQTVVAFFHVAAPSSRRVIPLSPSQKPGSVVAQEASHAGDAIGQQDPKVGAQSCRPSDPVPCGAPPRAFPLLSGQGRWHRCHHPPPLLWIRLAQAPRRGNGPAKDGICLGCGIVDGVGLDLPEDCDDHDGLRSRKGDGRTLDGDQDI